MKKVIMMMVMALTTMLFVGCSKASKYEKVLRDMNAVIEKIPEKDRKANDLEVMSEEEIKEKVEKFNKKTSEEQEMKIKEKELAISMLKQIAEKSKK